MSTLMKLHPKSAGIGSARVLENFYYYYYYFLNKELFSIKYAT